MAEAEDAKARTTERTNSTGFVRVASPPLRARWKKEAAMIDERTSSRYMWEYGCNARVCLVICGIIGGDVQARGVVTLGGLQQNAVFVSMSSIIQWL